MAGQGHLILLNREDSKKLFAQQQPEDVRKFVQQLANSAEYRKKQRVMDLGPCWNGIHRCLTDGTLEPDGGEPALNHAILGGRQIYRSDDFVVSLVRPDMTPYVADALGNVKYEDFHRNYLKIDANDYGCSPSEKDFEKLWITFQQVRLFYESASQDLSAVIFAATR